MIRKKLDNIVQDSYSDARKIMETGLEGQKDNIIDNMNKCSFSFWILLFEKGMSSYYKEYFEDLRSTCIKRVEALESQYEKYIALSYKVSKIDEEIKLVKFNLDEAPENRNKSFFELDRKKEGLIDRMQDEKDEVYAYIKLCMYDFFSLLLLHRDIKDEIVEEAISDYVKGIASLSDELRGWFFDELELEYFGNDKRLVKKAFSLYFNDIRDLYLDMLSFFTRYEDFDADIKSLLKRIRISSIDATNKVIIESIVANLSEREDCSLLVIFLYSMKNIKNVIELSIHSMGIDEYLLGIAKEKIKAEKIYAWLLFASGENIEKWEAIVADHFAMDVKLQNWLDWTKYWYKAAKCSSIGDYNKLSDIKPTECLYFDLDAGQFLLNYFNLFVYNMLRNEGVKKTCELLKSIEDINPSAYRNNDYFIEHYNRPGWYKNIEVSYLMADSLSGIYVYMNSFIKRIINLYNILSEVRRTSPTNEDYNNQIESLFLEYRFRVKLVNIDYTSSGYNKFRFQFVDVRNGVGDWNYYPTLRKNQIYYRAPKANDNDADKTWHHVLLGLKKDSVIQVNLIGLDGNTILLNPCEYNSNDCTRDVDGDNWVVMNDFYNKLIEAKKSGKRFEGLRQMVGYDLFFSEWLHEGENVKFFPDMDRMIFDAYLSYATNQDELFKFHRFISTHKMEGINKHQYGIRGKQDYKFLDNQACRSAYNELVNRTDISNNIRIFIYFNTFVKHAEAIEKFIFDINAKAQDFERIDNSYNVCDEILIHMKRLKNQKISISNYDFTRGKIHYNWVLEGEGCGKLDLYGAQITSINNEDKVICYTLKRLKQGSGAKFSSLMVELRNANTVEKLDKISAKFSDKIKAEDLTDKMYGRFICCALSQCISFKSGAEKIMSCIRAVLKKNLYLEETLDNEVKREIEKGFADHFLSYPEDKEIFIDVKSGFFAIINQMRLEDVKAVFELYYREIFHFFVEEEEFKEALTKKNKIVGKRFEQYKKKAL